jgi:hypothetical protein
VPRCGAARASGAGAWRILGLSNVPMLQNTSCSGLSGGDVLLATLQISAVGTMGEPSWASQAGRAGQPGVGHAGLARAASPAQASATQALAAWRAWLPEWLAADAPRARRARPQPRGGRLSPLGLGLRARRRCRCARPPGKAAQMRADSWSTCYSPARALGPGDAGARHPKHGRCCTSDARTAGASAAPRAGCTGSTRGLGMALLRSCSPAPSRGDISSAQARY